MSTLNSPSITHIEEMLIAAVADMDVMVQQVARVNENLYGYMHDLDHRVRGLEYQNARYRDEIIQLHNLLQQQTNHPAVFAHSTSEADGEYVPQLSSEHTRSPSPRPTSGRKRGKRVTSDKVLKTTRGGGVQKSRAKKPLQINVPTQRLNLTTLGALPTPLNTVSDPFSRSFCSLAKGH